MLRKMSLTLAAVICVSCAATSNQKFMKPGATQADYDRDYNYCMRTEYESTAYTTDGRFSAAMADMMLGASRLKNCMARNGWELVTINQNEIRPSLGYLLEDGKIVGLLEGGPMEVAGAKLCDQLVEVNGTPVLYDEDARKVQPTLSVPTDVTLRRSGELVEIEVQAVEVDWSNNTIEKETCE